MEALIKILKVIIDTIVGSRSLLKDVSPHTKQRLGKGFLAIYQSITRMVSNANEIAVTLEQLLVRIASSLPADRRSQLLEEYHRLEKKLACARTDKTRKQRQNELEAFKNRSVFSLADGAAGDLIPLLNAAFEKQMNEINHYLRLLKDSRVPWISLVTVFDPSIEKHLASTFAYSRDLYGFDLLPFHVRAYADQASALKLLDTCESDIGSQGLFSSWMTATSDEAGSMGGQERDLFHAIAYGHESSLLVFVYDGIGRLNGLRATLRAFIVANFEMDVLL